MHLFKSLTLKWWQISLLKLSLISFGIILGIYFQTFFFRWIVFVTILFVVPGIYLVKVWWRQ